MSVDAVPRQRIAEGTAAFVLGSDRLLRLYSKLGESIPGRCQPVFDE